MLREDCEKSFQQASHGLNGKAIPVPFLAALSEAERITEAGIKYHKVSGAVYPAGYGHGGNRGGAEDFWREVLSDPAGYSEKPVCRRPQRSS